MMVSITMEGQFVVAVDPLSKSPTEQIDEAYNHKFLCLIQNEKRCFD